MSEKKKPGIGSLVADLVRDLIRSKKFAALIAGVLANLAVLLSAKLGIPDEQAAAAATKITGLIGTYLLGQGVADAGKEKARLETTPEPPS